MNERADFAETPRHLASRSDGPDLLMNVVRAISKTLKESGGDYTRLTAVERRVQRVDVFDSYFTNDGLDGYFANVPLPKVWRETEEALGAVGATPVAEVFRKARLFYIDKEEEFALEEVLGPVYHTLDAFRREINALEGEVCWGRIGEEWE